MQNLRSKINKIDLQLLTLLAERQKVSREIGIYKKQNKIAINQPKREQELLAKLSSISKKKKIDPIFVQKLFKLIFHYSKKVQKGS